MYVYKERDIVSNDIASRGNYEYLENKNIISALEYYSKKKI